MVPLAYAHFLLSPWPISTEALWLFRRGFKCSLVLSLTDVLWYQHTHISSVTTRLSPWVRVGHEDLRPLMMRKDSHPDVLDLS